MSPQSQIAHYRILSKLGEGGMGAVYRATDTGLNRDVAIKVLPPAFAEDAARMQRFEREAQVLASLDHPNIAAIYGIEAGALVMELVEGPDLSGPLPIDTVIDYARQIAAGLEAAHEKGIVHRDLKPANIKVTPDGVVKLLDFGLAKATEASAAASATMSPTLSLAMTQAGMILGTAAYMSPEQARGHVVDKRSDIWAFGVMLHELLTGKQVFHGETISDTMAAVLRAEIDFDALPGATPPAVRRLLRRSLERDRKKRLPDIGVARLELDEPAETPAAAITAAPAAAPQRAWLPWALCALVTLTLGGLLWRAIRPAPPPVVQRFSADLGPEAVAASHITAAISADGTRIAYLVGSPTGPPMLATRLMEQSKPAILAGTEDAQDLFFSPDGQWIGFFAAGHLKKVSVRGGAPTVLCEVSGVRGSSWGEDGRIVFGGVSGSGLSRIPANGGAVEAITKPFDTGDSSHRWPQILPGGEAILFTGHNAGGGFDDAKIEILFLKTGKTKIVQPGGYFGRYLLSGHLVFVHQGTLFAVSFDVARGEVRGTPVPILEDVAADPSSAGGQLDFSRTGTLAYLSGKPVGETRRLLSMDGTGKQQLLMTAIRLSSPRLSPDGKRLAFGTMGDIAVYDLARGSTTRFALQSGGNGSPVWAPDGSHIAYAPLSGGIWWTRTDGSGQPEHIYTKSGSALPVSFTPDGHTLAFTQAGADTGPDLWTLPLDMQDPDHPKAGTPELFLATKGIDIEPVFSPDGRWLAYSSNQSGEFQVFVRPYPEGAKGGGQTQLSVASGRTPRWSRTAKELFYVTTDGQVMVVPYSVNGRTLEPGKPRRWIDIQNVPGNNPPPFDLAPDGKHIVAFPAAETPAVAEKVNVHVTFVLSFFDYVKQALASEGK